MGPEFGSHGYAVADRVRDGFTLAARLADAAPLADHLAGFLASQGVLGLVERLEACCWLAGTERGEAELYRLDTEDGGMVEPCAPATLVVEWPAGRVFGIAAEWRWRTLADGSLTLLGLSEERSELEDAAAGLVVDAAAVQDGWQVFEHTLLPAGSTVLSSEGLPGAHGWNEVRIPRPLLYPVAHGGRGERRPRLTARSYARASGAVHFTRLCSMSVGTE